MSLQLCVVLTLAVIPLTVGINLKQSGNLLRKQRADIDHIIDTVYRNTLSLLRSRVIIINQV